MSNSGKVCMHCGIYLFNNYYLIMNKMDDIIICCMLMCGGIGGLNAKYMCNKNVGSI